MDGVAKSISAVPNVKGGDVLYTVHICSTHVYSAFALLPAAVLIEWIYSRYVSRNRSEQHVNAPSALPNSDSSTRTGWMPAASRRACVFG